LSQYSYGKCIPLELQATGKKEKIAIKCVNLSRKQSRLFCAIALFLSLSQDSNKNQHENKFLFLTLAYIKTSFWKFFCLVQDL
jgi:hypothetical protein